MGSLLVDPTNHQQVLQVVNYEPALTSKDANWDGIILAHFSDLPAGESPTHRVKQHALYIIDSPQPIPAESKLDGKHKEHVYRCGDVTILPARVDYWARWDGGDITTITLHPGFMERVALETMEGNPIELTPQSSVADPAIYHISQALKYELASGCVMGKLYSESLITALAIRLFHGYGVVQTKPSTKKYGLSKIALKQILEYINAHLEQQLGLTELAAIAKISPHYFCKCFKQSTGFTPHQYVIRRRVERAQQLLENREMSISQVAQVVGFANQSHLNRHCKNLLGVTPKQIQSK